MYDGKFRWMTDGTEEMMLNYSGNQFSAAGFTFLLFDVLNTKVRWKSTDRQCNPYIIASQGEDGFLKTALSIAHDGRKTLVGPKNTLYRR